MNEFVNILQQILMGLLVALVPVLTKFIIEVLVAYKNKLLAEIENSKPELRWVLDEAVDIAVRAAEQSNLAGFIEDKKQYAFQIAQQYLDDHGWNEVNIDVLEAAIEAEVLKQFPK